MESAFSPTGFDDVPVTVVLVSPDVASPVHLVWEAPAGCPSKESVSEQLERLLAGWKRPGDAPVTAHVRVHHAAGKRWRVEVTTDNGTTRGERTLDAETCATAAKAATLVIVLALAPELAGGARATGEGGPASDPKPGGAPEPQAAPAPAPATAQEPEPPGLVEPPVVPRDEPSGPGQPRPRASSVTWILGAKGIGTIGRLPTPSAGIGVIAAARVHGVRIEAGASAYLARNVSSEAKPDVGATFTHYAADLRACYGPRYLTWTFAGCLGGWGGRLDGEGFGGADRLRGGEWQAGPLAGALVTWEPSRRWALRLQPELAYQALGRHDFLLYGTERAYRAPRLRGDVSFGLELHF